MFYDECAPRVTFMGNAVWPLSAFNPFRSLFLLAFFLFLSISSPILQTFRNVDFDIRYFLFILVTFLFFLLSFLRPTFVARNSRRNCRKWGGVGSSVAPPSCASEKNSHWKVGGRIQTTWHTSPRVWLTILKSFPRIFPQLSGEIFSNNNLVECLRQKFLYISICADF